VKACIFDKASHRNVAEILYTADFLKVKADIFEMTERTGVDVMITIFGDFGQFSAKKWRFSQQPTLLSNFCKS
jgi:hypothetical protein